MSEEQVPVKRTAAQRLDDLENAFISTFRTVEQIGQEIQVIKEAIRLLGNKSEAIARLVVKGSSPDNANLTAEMVQINVENLESKLNDLKANGILVSEEVTTPNSFIVGREVDDLGNITNARIQFQLSRVETAVQAALSGSKAGDVVTIVEGKSKFEVLEVYSIQQPEPLEPQVEA